MSVMTRLLRGYQKFHRQFFKSEQRDLYKGLVEKGQAPKIMMISCSDSRVDPATLFNYQPGEVFVVRNVANLVPPCENDGMHHGTSAALEFAVCTLEVEHVIVMGHTHCGGIQALLRNDPPNTSPNRGFITRWMDIAFDARDQAQRVTQDPVLQEKACCEYALQASLDNLKSFPWIMERVQQKKLQLHVWYFDLMTGHVAAFDEQTERFVPLEDVHL
jgi:carbonic anhydrase